MNAGKITVLIADDHPVVRQGLRVLLSLEDDIEVVGEVGDGGAAAGLGGDSERLIRAAPRGSGRPA